MRKIYVVEDNDAIRKVLELFLTSKDYEVKSFGSVGEFTRGNVGQFPDLYLFDVMLPDGSGIDLCQEIKNNKDNHQIPVIMMSAHANLNPIKDLCGADDVIAKPFDLHNVDAKIQAIFT